MIYIVVPTYNREVICKKFVAMLEKQTFQDYKLILVDHGKHKVDLYENEKIKVIKSDVNGWARAVNVGLKYILTISQNVDDIVLVINDDVYLENNYLSKIEECINEKPNSIIGTCCINKKNNKTLRVSIKIDKIKAKNIYLYKGIDFNSIPDGYLESELLTGKGVVIPVDVFKCIGLYNEEKLPHYKADHELIWRAKKSGISVYVTNKLILYTYADQKRVKSTETYLENMKKMFFSMTSTYNLKDLVNYSFVSFDNIYAIYYILLNFFRYILFNTADYFKAKRIEIESE